MRVLVVGGTGLIGQHTVDALCERGHEATRVARSGAERTLDVTVARPPELERLLDGHEGLVVAWGVDDRAPVRRPAIRAFRRGNVDVVARLLAAAEAVGVRVVVVCGSMFTCLDRAHPHLRLGTRHPYVRSRLEQVSAAHAAAPHVRIVVLEIPFVLGAVPGRRPLWTPVVRYAASHLPLFAMPGATTMLSARSTADAIVGGLANEGVHGCLPLGDRDVSLVAWMEGMAARAGRRRRARVLPPSVVEAAASLHVRRLRRRGLEHGVDPRHVVHLFAAHGTLPETEVRAAQAALGYTPTGLEEAWTETVEAALA